MKTKKHISKSIGTIAIALLLLGSLMSAVFVQHSDISFKVEKSKSKAPVEHNIKANNDLAAVIPSLNVQFLGIIIDFLKPFEAVSLPLLFEIQPCEFVSSYITNLLNHFISPRAP